MKKKKTFVMFVILVLLLAAIGIVVKYVKYQNTPMPEGLHPIVAKKKEELIAKANDKGIGVLVYDDFRTVEEQDELYQQGRTTDGNIVTYSKGGESYHNYGLAIDFALELEDGSVIWDLEYDGNRNGEADWLEVVSIAKELGFEWGGEWQNFQDYPHLQMDFGLSIRELQWGKRPGNTITVQENMP